MPAKEKQEKVDVSWEIGTVQQPNEPRRSTSPAENGE